MSTIVVVDDDPDICTLIELKLERSGHEVVVEHDGEGGLAAVRAVSPALVLLDWMMPRMTGLEVCLAIRQDEALRNLLVVLLTARAQAGDLRRGMAAGADDYLVKPFSPRGLAVRVDELLGGTRG